VIELDPKMQEKLEGLKLRYQDLTHKLGDPSIISNSKELEKVAREHSHLAAIVDVFQAFKQTTSELEEVRSMLDGVLESDERDLFQEEYTHLKEQYGDQMERLRLMLVPKDPMDDKNVVVEIRAGTGGDEATLFAQELFRMYSRMAERKRWKVEVLDISENEAGGVKEVIFQINAEGAYSRLKYEGGVHRVQRVPATEAQGRIHTSTVTVAIMPEAQEIDVEIKPDDIRIEAQRASGAGGQHVNKTESAIRITHLETGLVVYCQDERSQVQNREKAMRVLRTRLLAVYESRARSVEDAQRRSQVGSGERSEKIRTYNFPQDRMTDHRIGLTVHNLPGLMDGEIDHVINALAQHEQTEKLQNMEQA